MLLTMDYVLLFGMLQQILAR
uniref:Uncharacterized protein n=1 Tax=Anguilla anguilla TaxID=7936 RepID=A0A0E9TEN8_ANGAN